MRLKIRTNAQRGSEILTPGVNWESTVSFVEKTKNHLVFHTSGGSHWSGIGVRGYHSAEFHVCEIVEEEQDSEHWISLEVNKLISFPAQNRNKK